jgi:WD40 repeat protein
VDRDSIVSLSWHPDGQSIAFGSSCGVLFFESALDEFVMLISTEPSQRITSVAFNPDGSLLAAAVYRFGGSQLSGTYVWDMSSGEPVLPSPASNSITPLEWHPLEDVLAIGFGDEVRLLDVRTGDITHRFAAPDVFDLNVPYYVQQICWSPQGSYLRAYFNYTSYILTYPDWETAPTEFVAAWGDGCNDNMTALILPGVGILDFATNHQTRTEYPCNGASVAWRPDGNREHAVNCDDRTVRIYNRQAELVAQLDGDLAEQGFLVFTRSIAYSPDGSRLVALGNDGYARMWDTSTYELLTRVNIADLANNSLEEIEN